MEKNKWVILIDEHPTTDRINEFIELLKKSSDTGHVMVVNFEKDSLISCGPNTAMSIKEADIICKALNEAENAALAD